MDPHYGLLPVQRPPDHLQQVSTNTEYLDEFAKRFEHRRGVVIEISRGISVLRQYAPFHQWRQSPRESRRFPRVVHGGAQDVLNRRAAIFRLDGDKLKRRMVTSDGLSSKAQPLTFFQINGVGRVSVDLST